MTIIQPWRSVNVTFLPEGERSDYQAHREEIDTDILREDQIGVIG